MIDALVISDGCHVARAEHLPIYKASDDPCLSLEQVVRSFSRYHKYTLGTDLRDGARRVLKHVVRADTRRDKAPVLLPLREEGEGWFRPHARDPVWNELRHLNL